MIWGKHRSPADRIVLAAEVKARAELLIDQMQENLSELRTLLVEEHGNPGTTHRPS